MTTSFSPVIGALLQFAKRAVPIAAPTTRCVFFGWKTKEYTAYYYNIPTGITFTFLVDHEHSREDVLVVCKLVYKAFAEYVLQNPGVERDQFIQAPLFIEKTDKIINDFNR
ncbi:Trafficking protein particle complex subunit like protein [Aduncisulcus paluster]|uniref:Trafficking protein particle complex subunit like protein n=1 Tax=Aduncisulcus paluster TaxID=2918883 RepID=A0ABQ5KIY8_9EUKA|nr:Trafficking protein particle complex subunit like protein [Aduncisulcus paluster]